MDDLQPPDRAPYLLLASDGVIGDDVEIGAHVVLFAGVELRVSVASTTTPSSGDTPD